MKRITPSPALLRDGIVAVLRADDASRYQPAAEILTEEGIRSIELTLTTPGTLGFYCDKHFAIGMVGAVLVVPAGDASP